ncbi:MAG: nucleotidyltransferase family protein [Timaviella obliquedivisa GSE-PSE-MK23-08B]|jgi:hypothetical protein|nr:nucleotidyltransferase family protein [Timaviella obliquedivisa GSE-PSE-MK23-08B]
MDIQELLQEKREEILAPLAVSAKQHAAKHGAYNVRVFGSVARGEAKEASDIDFLVDVGQRHSSWFLVGLKLDLQDLLERDVDVATENALHVLIRERVLNEAVPQ